MKTWATQITLALNRRKKFEKAKSYQDNAIFALDPNNSPFHKYHGFINKILRKKKGTSEAKQNRKWEAVKPNPLLSTAFVAYSTWKTRPSGEKMVTDRS